MRWLSAQNKLQNTGIKWWLDVVRRCHWCQGELMKNVMGVVQDEANKKET